MFGKCSGTLMWHNFRRIFVNIRKMGENPRKIVEKVVIMQYFYLINKIIHDCSWIWNISSRVQLYISLIRCANLWNIKLNTRSGIPYLRAPMYYPLFITNLITGKICYGLLKCYWKECHARNWERTLLILTTQVVFDNLPLRACFLDFRGNKGS